VTRAHEALVAIIRADQVQVLGVDRKVELMRDGEQTGEEDQSSLQQTMTPRAGEFDMTTKHSAIEKRLLQQLD
jgi:hypothetical protein